jgi:serine O-acetyltransferase
VGWLADFKLDVQRCVDDGVTPVRARLTQQGLWALFEYRLAREGRKVPALRPLFTAWQKAAEAAAGISLGHHSRIGPGLWITHFGGVIVQDEAIIGSNCHLCQGVTIGRGHGSGGYGAPVLEDDVYVGPNAVVLGKITVGRGARIGANSVVTANVPPGTHVWPSPSIARPGPEHGEDPACRVSPVSEPTEARD